LLEGVALAGTFFLPFIGITNSLFST
jgi:hypothetical protein